MAVYARAVAREDHPLRFKASAFARGIEGSVRVDELPWKRQHFRHIAGRVLIALRQVVSVLSKGVRVQIYGELAIV